MGASAELRFCISDTDIALSGPSSVLSIVDRMLLTVERTWNKASDPIKIEVSCAAEIWRIHGEAPASRKVLGARSALPQVAGAIVSAILAEVAFHKNVVVWRAAVVERENRALVFIGDDWESCVTILAHLHTRGWKILGGDYALISGDTLVVSAFKKLLHANSSCIASFPSWYRQAIEASPWYSSSRAIAFYAIDPQLTNGTLPWGESAPLGAVLKVDGQFADHPYLEATDHIAFSGSLRAADLKRAGVEISNLIVGDFIETCDLVERWFASLAVPA